MKNGDEYLRATPLPSQKLPLLPMKNIISDSLKILNPLVIYLHVTEIFI